MLAYLNCYTSNRMCVSANIIAATTAPLYSTCSTNVNDHILFGLFDRFVTRRQALLLVEQMWRMCVGHLSICAFSETCISKYVEK